MSLSPGSDKHNLGRWIKSQEEIWVRVSIPNSSCQNFKDERFYQLEQVWRGCDGLWHLINSLPSKRTCVWHLWFISDLPVWWAWVWGLLPNYFARLHAKRFLSHLRLSEIQILPTGDPRECTEWRFAFCLRWTTPGNFAGVNQRLFHQLVLPLNVGTLKLKQ